MLPGSGWVQRIPSGVMITTKSVPVSVPDLLGVRLQDGGRVASVEAWSITGESPTVRATARTWSVAVWSASRRASV